MATEMRRTDAKAFFANERTFLHWMSTSVTIGGIAAALSGEHVRIKSYIQVHMLLGMRDGIMAAHPHPWGKLMQCLLSGARWDSCTWAVNIIDLY